MTFLGVTGHFRCTGEGSITAQVCRVTMGVEGVEEEEPREDAAASQTAAQLNYPAPA